ncbi:interleukin-17 receptor E isoform X2 [Hypomesus transpacificus]|uniref:interleukin-17 receptor E isoform X2 n=1 Tax=Hypomesus transpacificus TaxID=137520 RepID=UPI001F085749|nr:interleukin-17 receptor E isoform X2 [Hypomesus transpacificus]
MLCCNYKPAFVVLMVSLVRSLTAVEVVRRMHLTAKGRDCQNGSLSSLNSSSQLSLSTVCFSWDSERTPCVRVLATISATDFPSQNKSLEINSNDRTRTIYIKKQKREVLKWYDNLGNKGKTKIVMAKERPLIELDLVFNCLQYAAEREIFVSLSTNPKCSISYTVKDVCSVVRSNSDPVPIFNVSVDQLSRTFTVTVETGQPVNILLCYKTTEVECSPLSSTTIEPSKSQSATLSFPFLLPCVCLQVYYTDPDATRVSHCPFNNGSPVGTDVWRSSEVTLYGGTSLAWKSPCPPSYIQPTAALCWRDQGATARCTPIINSTLERTEESHNCVKYNISAVDKHSQMCVQFSFHGSKDVQCPFEAGFSSWDVYVGPGWKSLYVYLYTKKPASFSAQHCVLEKGGCISTGPVHSTKMGEVTRETHMILPLAFLTDDLCVQVWKSDPAHLGRRILCTDYSHGRYGLLVVATLTLLVTMAMLGRCVYYMTNTRVAGWLSIQRPVLLLCSSEQADHVSAVCALASILQGELCAAVRMALWAHSSGGRHNEIGPGSEAEAGVTELGPLPWLYGQWEAVQAAGGKVLITWSPEANTSYNCWKWEKTDVEKREGKIAASMSKEGTRTEPSPVTGPVFRAALSYLQGAMQKGGKHHGCILVYFQGFCHAREIPNDLKGIPRYCLPQDFGGLIQELVGTADETRGTTHKRQCWRRLLSKTLSFWLARRLSRRLTAWLPQQQTCSKTKNKQGKAFSQEVMSEKESLSGITWR